MAELVYVDALYYWSIAAVPLVIERDYRRRELVARAAPIGLTPRPTIEPMRRYVATASTRLVKNLVASLEIRSGCYVDLDEPQKRSAGD
ncbi:hypothetical protein EVAR_87065_1 [Eumeta japonica]|uniref:Uncharacterized protein n=1 Tax=Eumeta variegata TaxID=151549 RepID=A0A4C1VSK8_EUMVA|nr:hypothetical protein EVAR_87065_1 [Eumeta japonica]